METRMTNSFRGLDFLSDHESTNIIDLQCSRVKRRHIKFGKPIGMNRLEKGKGAQRGSSSRQPQFDEEMLIHTDQHKSTTSSLKWPEEHNVALGELLLEQYLYGNISNCVLKKDKWFDVVSALNRRLGTAYTEAIVMTRYKNMKADFKMIYQLSKQSGWRWDEQLHVLIATDEIWDEVIQDNPKMARFKRNSFHQYEIFERMFAENIAVGITARSSKNSGSNYIPEEAEGPHNADEFKTNNGFSSLEKQDTQVQIEFTEPSKTQLSLHPMVGSKRSSEDLTRNTRSKHKAYMAKLDKILTKQNENADMISNSLNAKHSMSDCLEKLANIESISLEAMLAVNDALTDNNDNKTTLMTWDGEILRKWIEHLVSRHPQFYASIVWL